jgi:hypothetical protein
MNQFLGDRAQQVRLAAAGIAECQHVLSMIEKVPF